MKHPRVPVSTGILITEGDQGASQTRMHNSRRGVRIRLPGSKHHPISFILSGKSLYPDCLHGRPSLDLPGMEGSD